MDIGMSPTEAIASATGRAAEQMGLDDVGVIAEGKRADSLLLSRDPAENIHNTRAIDSVWVNGVCLIAKRF
ncbi:MAG: amidohydrolase family protein [Calditrichia bacterium]